MRRFAFTSRTAIRQWSIQFLFLISLCFCIPSNAANIQMDPFTQEVRITPKLIQQHAHEPIYSYQVVKKYHLLLNAFIEGLYKIKDSVVLSSGLYDYSYIARVKLSNGKVLQKHALPKQYFAEGISHIGDKIYQLTYLSNEVFVYDNNFTLLATHHTPFQGWGLTTDGHSLILSNGTSSLIYLSPKTFQVEKILRIQTSWAVVTNLNELEYADGKIYANIFHTNLIVIIAAKTGRVMGWINLTGINRDDKRLAPYCVANGIAYNEQSKHLMVGGKCWSYLYEIKLSSATLSE